MAPGFKRTYCHDCRPHLIGVWDTVGSMGWFWGRKFFDSTLNHDVKYGYHAVSIDERRKKFPANMWNEDVKADHQTIEQIWFAGVHSDVGGWYRDAGLSDIALEWMLDRAEARGLRLRPDWLRGWFAAPASTVWNRGFDGRHCGIVRQSEDGPVSVIAEQLQYRTVPPHPSRRASPDQGADHLVRDRRGDAEGPGRVS